MSDHKKHPFDVIHLLANINNTDNIITMASSSLSVVRVPTHPISGQKTGTSGLRKRVKEFQGENYLNNWIQVRDS